MIEGLPAELRVAAGLAGAADAIEAVHFPEGESDVEQARERLAFEELFLYQAILATRSGRIGWRGRRRGSGRRGGWWGGGSSRCRSSRPGIS